MILDRYLSTNEVVASHIIGLTNRHCLALLNLDPENDLWSEKNGILMFAAFEKVYEAQDIVSIFELYIP